MDARYTEGRAHGSQCSSPGNAGERATQFFALAKSTASLRIVLQRLASQCRFQLLDVFLGILEIRSGHYRLIRTECHQRAFQIRYATMMELAGTDVGSPGH